jgi:hypothetical protein
MLKTTGCHSRCGRMSGVDCMNPAKPRRAAALVAVGVALAYLLGVTRWHGWAWPGWEALVAAETLLLAFGTWLLARQTTLDVEAPPQRGSP